MLAAAFLTTCQTVFSEIPCSLSSPARQTHRNSGPFSIPATVNHASRVSSPNLARSGSYVSALANEIQDGPALLAPL
jgi:hypothetical protein